MNERPRYERPDAMYVSVPGGEAYTCMFNATGNNRETHLTTTLGTGVDTAKSELVDWRSVTDDRLRYIAYRQEAGMIIIATCMLNPTTASRGYIELERHTGADPMYSVRLRNADPEVPLWRAVAECTSSEVAIELLAVPLAKLEELAVATRRVTTEALEAFEISINGAR